MPHKRHTGQFLNKNNCIQSRVQYTNSSEHPPNVCVYQNNGSVDENLSTTEAREYGGEFCTAPESANYIAPEHQEAIVRLATPHYNTTVRKRNEIAILHQMRPVAIQNDVDLTPRTKMAIAPKVTQKMNFPLDRPAVFKDLVPLNVNDSILQPLKSKPFKKGSSKERNSEAQEPQLADYVEQIERVELVIPEPNIHLDFPLDDFNFFEAFKKVYNS
ncbi:uncharacterized protein LOC115626099 [Scaptodrosophila lebanonensis]|uniref:Uncharacterized protein LOC115626099 n=1 Tax=Drosophila lebanonensis TaxID=7225 RepID=A0A6J2TKS2_DROLE|nr:uncharacterized protein LOC115626099 [Scaptodrosophila lebanonensis]